MSHDGTPYRLKLLLVYWCEARADYRVTIVVQLSVRHARLFQLNAGSQANFGFSLGDFRNLNVRESFTAGRIRPTQPIPSLLVSQEDLSCLAVFSIANAPFNRER